MTCVYRSISAEDVRGRAGTAPDGPDSRSAAVGMRQDEVGARWGRIGSRRFDRRAQRVSGRPPSEAVETAARTSRSPPPRTRRPGRVRCLTHLRVRGQCPRPSDCWGAVAALRTRGYSPRRRTLRLSSGEFIRSWRGPSRHPSPAQFAGEGPGVRGPRGARRCCRSAVGLSGRRAREHPSIIPDSSRSGEVTHLAHFSHLRRGRQRPKNWGFFRYTRHTTVGPGGRRSAHRGAAGRPRRDAQDGSAQLWRG
jgi:hypothetical protein